MDTASLDAWTRSALGHAFTRPELALEALGPSNARLALIGVAALRAALAAALGERLADARDLSAALDERTHQGALCAVGVALEVQTHHGGGLGEPALAQATAALFGAARLDGGEAAVLRLLDRAALVEPAARVGPTARTGPSEASPRPVAERIPRPAADAIPRPAADATPRPAADAIPRPAADAARQPRVAPPPTGRPTEPPRPAPAWATGEILDVSDDPLAPEEAWGAPPPTRADAPPRPSVRPAPARPTPPPKAAARPAPASAPPQAAPPPPVAAPTTWLPAGDAGAPPPPPASFQRITREGAAERARGAVQDAVAAAFGGGPQGTPDPGDAHELPPLEPGAVGAAERLRAWLAAETGDPAAAPQYHDAELGGWGYGSPTAWWRTRVVLPMGFSFTGEGGSAQEARERAAAQACRHLGVG